MKENSFALSEAWSRRYLAEIITDPDYAEDIVLLAQAESLLHSLEQVALVSM